MDILDNAAPEKEPADDSLRASLEAAWDTVEQAEAAPAGDTREEAPATEEKPAISNRDPATGQFTAKTDDAPVKAAPVKTEAPITAPKDPAKVTAPAPSNAPDGPPVSWAADAKATWSTLPPAVQAAAIKREREASEGIRQYSEKVQRYEASLSPLAQEAARSGVDVDTGIKTLLGWSQALSRDPVAAISALAKSRGIDITINGRSEQPQIDPVVYDLRQQVSSLTQQQQAFFDQQTAAEIESYRSNASYPHFDAVRVEMAKLITGGLANSIPDAYAKAVRLSPDIADAMAREAESKRDADRLAATRDAAAKARLAGSPVRGAPVGTRQPASDRSLREELSELFDDMSSR